MVADAVSIIVSIVLSSFIRLGPLPGWHYVLEHIPTLTASTLVLLLVFYAGGMYERQSLMRERFTFRLPITITLIGISIIILLFYARFRFHIGRGILLLAGLFIIFFIWMSRRLFRVAIGYGLFSKNALIVGESREAGDVIHLLRTTEESGYKLFGIVHYSLPEKGAFIEGVPVLGGLNNLRDFVEAYAVETIIVATPLAKESRLLQSLRYLRYAGVEILDYVSLHEELAQEISLDHIDDEWLMNAAMNSSRIHIRQVKRMLDLFAACVGLVVLSPLSLLAAMLVKITSPGPVFYRQERAGLDNKVYIVYKFRTMKENAEAATGAIWSSASDQRVTAIGAFLRKWRIDEIPQLYNVLRGEMSLVGPRPERPEFVESLSATIPFYKERLLVPPGITGWAQVRYPYAASIQATRRKLQYDLYYIKNMSFFLDCLVLLSTFRTIIIGIRHSEDYDTREEREFERRMSVMRAHSAPKENRTA